MLKHEQHDETRPTEATTIQRYSKLVDLIKHSRFSFSNFFCQFNHKALKNQIWLIEYTWLTMNLT